MSLRSSSLLALGVLLVGLLLAGCSADGDSDSGSDAGEETTTNAESVEAEPPDPSGDQGGVSRFNARQIYADASEGVVTVITVLDEENRNPLGGGGGQGSGFVINDEGEIVTNAHVVTDAQASQGDGDINAADQVFVEFADRNAVPAEIVGFDPNADIALLKIKPDGLDLRPLQFGDSEQVEIGTPVAAIGSPFGQDQSLSTGIISATQRSIESLTDFRIEGALQTDASINPGNSGGPLIDPSGRVIGVNQQINTTSGGNEGVGFAVPANLVTRSIEDLREDGEAEYAFIGVTTVPLYPQLAERLDVDAPTGSLILEVTSGSPADEAGLRGAGDETIRFQGREVEVGGDVIVAVDGERLEGENDLSRLITNQQPGQTVEVEIIRDGDRRTIDVKLQARPNQID